MVDDQSVVSSIDKLTKPEYNHYQLSNYAFRTESDMAEEWPQPTPEHTSIPYYRPQREWAWDDADVQATYALKRAKLAEKGFVTDEEVAAWFLQNGASVRPQDVRAIILDSVTESAFSRLVRSLSL
jgi:hypothetical protein